MMSKMITPVRFAVSQRAITQCAFRSASNQLRPVIRSFSQQPMSFRCFHSATPACFSSPITPPAATESAKQPIDQTADQSVVQSADATTTAVAPPKKVGKLRLLWRQYGMVAVGSYFFFYFGTMGMLFVVLHNKLLPGVDPAALIEYVGAASYFDGESSQMKQDAIVAWLTTECTEPVRLALTALTTPPLARMLGRVPSKAQVEADLAAKAASEEAPAAAPVDNKSSTSNTSQ